MFHVIRIFLENSKTLQYRRQTYVFVGGKLGTFAMSQQNGRRMGLKACYCFWFTCLADDINSL
jgi:hypothetical protein